MAPQWFACRLDNLGRYILVRYSAKELAIEADKTPKRRLAKPQRLVEHLIKDGLKVAGRRIDDLQYLGRSSLLLSRISEFAPQRITFGRALVELLLEIGDDLLGIG
jgi:hypothetical protein